jgi:hypothetical protein
MRMYYDRAEDPRAAREEWRPTDHGTEQNCDSPALPESAHQPTEHGDLSGSSRL